VKNILRMISCFREYVPHMVGASCIGSCTIASSVGLMMASAYLISAAALHPSIVELSLAIVGVRFFGIIRGVFRYAERLVSHRVTFTISARIRVWFYDAVEPIAPAGLFKHSSGDLLKRVASDVESVELIFTRLVAPAFVGLSVTVLTSAVLLLFAQSVAVAAFAGLVVAGVVVPLCSILIGNRLYEQVSSLQSMVCSMALDLTQGMPELIAYGLVDDHKKRLKEVGDLLIDIQHKGSVISTVTEQLVTFIMYLTVFGQMLLVAPLVTDGTIEGVWAACVLLGTMAAFEAVLPLPAACQFLKQADNAAGELLDMIADSTIGEVEEPVNKLAAADKIEFRDVTFSYVSSSAPVLSKFNLAIEAGKVVVVKGPSGVGKSTLISLLFKIWLPQRGVVSSFCGDDMVDAHNSVTALSQKPYLFNGTIRDNMLVARPDANDDDIHRVMRIACVDGFVESLENGLETHVGEHGTTLSGGEMRRIAIARTLLADTPFLAFDEPTADLDAQTAASLLENLFALREQGKGVLIISHQKIPESLQPDQVIEVGTAG